MKSCVNLMSRLFEQPEEYVACYLDMYYQLRVRYEAEKDGLDGGQFVNRPYDADGGESVGAVHERPADAAQRPNKEKPAEVSIAKKPRPSRNANTAAHDAAVFKRAVRERLTAARKNGLTTGAIQEAAGPHSPLTHGKLMDILEGRVVGIDVYRELDRALDKLEASPPGD